MGKKTVKTKSYRGILAKVKALLNRNRLGELLVLKGLLSPGELKQALAQQKTDNEQLGKILVHQHLVSRQALYKVLGQQWTIRCLAAMFGIFIAFSSFGIRSVRAGAIKDLPAQITLVSAATPAFSSMNTYPALFGSEERASRNLEPFTKWTSMFERFERTMALPHGKNVIKSWKHDLVSYQGLSLEKMAERVNLYINKTNYIVDNRNWGKSDYWETPIEFFDRGGDCEDFAIAKYVSLRLLGVPEERLRIAIVHDLVKDIPHAVLVLYTDSGALILDNQSSKVKLASHITRYRPIFTINRQAWWLHTKPQSTVLASAQ